MTGIDNQILSDICSACMNVHIDRLDCDKCIISFIEKTNKKEQFSWDYKQ